MDPGLFLIQVSTSTSNLDVIRHYKLKEKKVRKKKEEKEKKDITNLKKKEKKSKQEKRRKKEKREGKKKKKILYKLNQCVRMCHKQS